MSRETVRRLAIAGVLPHTVVCRGARQTTRRFPRAGSRTTSGGERHRCRGPGGFRRAVAGPCRGRGVMTGVRSVVYTLHLWPPIAHAKHYTGSAMERQLARRLTDHALGRGARLTQVPGRARRLLDAGPDRTRRPGRGTAVSSSSTAPPAGAGCARPPDGYQSGQLTAAEGPDPRRMGPGQPARTRAAARHVRLLSQAPENLALSTAWPPSQDLPAPRRGPASGEVRVIPAPRPGPRTSTHQITPEVVALVGQLEATWAAEREAAPRAANGSHLRNRRPGRERSAPPQHAG